MAGKRGRPPKSAVKVEAVKSPEELVKSIDMFLDADEQTVNRMPLLYRDIILKLKDRSNAPSTPVRPEPPIPTPTKENKPPSNEVSERPVQKTDFKNLDPETLLKVLGEYFPKPPPEIPDPPEYGKYSEKVLKMTLANILYDSQWADGLDDERDKFREMHPREWFNIDKPVSGEQRIRIKNVDQSDILTQIVNHQLTLDEIKQLRDFTLYYARNHYKIHKDKKPAWMT